MKKKPDWESIFDDFLAKNINRPFEWGKWDCVTFANEFVKQMTGESVLPKEWKWKTEEQAMKSIIKYGKGKGLAAGIVEAVKRIDAIKELKPAFITKGDFGVYKEESELCCIFDNYNAIGVNDQGIVVKKDVNIVKAWRVNG